MQDLLNYGCGMPFYRLEKLQSNLRMPVPASTQWEIVEAGGKIVQPVYEALIIRSITSAKLGYSL